ncbi:MAG: hypothetical protein KJZ78_22095 [Bryobacteraceae bacterium]|nr:hypothetical protein [Bryobacteraceae bacterium]
MSQVLVEEFTGGVASSRTRLSYGYDPQGIRITALEETDAAADGTYETRRETRYLIDHDNATGYAQTFAETVVNADTGAIIAKTVYVIGHDELTQTRYEYDAQGSVTSQTTHTFAHDGHGSVRVLLDAAATLAQIYTYAAYGQLLAIHSACGQLVGTTADAALTSYLYTGEYFDARSGLEYLRARWYDPSTGRFNRLDPFAGNLNDPLSLHKYLYTHGDPINGTDPTGLETLVGMLCANTINAIINRMDWAASYAAKQFAWASVETGFEVIIGKLISAATGIPFDMDTDDIARSLATNFASNLATSKLQKMHLLRNLLDFSIRTISDVAFGGQDILWAAGLNLVSLGVSELLAKYGAKILGECFKKYGPCFVAGTPLVVGFEDEPLESGRYSPAHVAFATERKTITRAIESVELGSRVVTEPPEGHPRDEEFDEPDQATWRQINFLQRRSDGTEIEAQLLRPSWWIEWLGLEVGRVIELQFPELQTTGTARVLGISACPPIEEGGGRVVIGRFLTRRVGNLVRVTLEDGSQLTGTTNHPVWSVDAETWRRMDELAAGERLSTLHGEAQIARVDAVSRPADVFNVEVHADHVYRLLGCGLLAHNADCANLVNQITAHFQDYPRIIDPRTGSDIEFPVNLVERIGTQANPLPWTNIERGKFISEWIQRGYPVPPEGWSSVQIHHIKPREWGGTNDFWNLVPLSPAEHTQFSNFFTTLRTYLNQAGLNLLPLGV